MTSRKNKQLHKEIDERFWKKEREERIATRKACLQEPESDLRHRVFVSCAIVDALNGSYINDFGFWNEAYWDAKFWQACQRRADEMEAEFKKDGSLPDGFYNLPPVDAYYSVDELEYGIYEQMHCPAGFGSDD